MVGLSLTNEPGEPGAAEVSSAGPEPGERELGLRPPHPVELRNPDQASGLADMLHQFLEQTVRESERKARAARALSGALLFRAAEDPEIIVRITFAKDKIELRDDSSLAQGLPWMRADFLSVAHLTTGEESPMALLLRRKIQARASLFQLPFLMRVLSFMKIPPVTVGAEPTAGFVRSHARALRWVILIVALSGIICWLATFWR